MKVTCEMVPSIGDIQNCFAEALSVSHHSSSLYLSARYSGSGAISILNWNFLITSSFFGASSRLIKGLAIYFKYRPGTPQPVQPRVIGLYTIHHKK